jgi:hypothetical protein
MDNFAFFLQTYVGKLSKVLPTCFNVVCISWISRAYLKVIWTFFLIWQSLYGHHKKVEDLANQQQTPS